MVTCFIAEDHKRPTRTRTREAGAANYLEVRKVFAEVDVGRASACATVAETPKAPIASVWLDGDFSQAVAAARRVSLNIRPAIGCPTFLELNPPCIFHLYSTLFLASSKRSA